MDHDIGNASKLGSATCRLVAGMLAHSGMSAFAVLLSLACSCAIVGSSAAARGTFLAVKSATVVVSNLTARLLRQKLVSIERTA